jgi:hypothetical protein
MAEEGLQKFLFAPEEDVSLNLQDTIVDATETCNQRCGASSLKNIKTGITGSASQPIDGPNGNSLQRFRNGSLSSFATPGGGIFENIFNGTESVL